MSKFGLGKGLADINAEMGSVPDISILAGAERVAVRQIPLYQIGANPDQPRKSFDAVELDDLAKSIREKGVLQPILLRAVRGRAHQYEIVAGERRFRASKIAGLSEIPALVKDIDDNNAMEIALIENVQREDLNPLEEAAAYRGLIESHGYALADVVRLIGKSESYIRNIMRLEILPKPVKEMIEQGKLSASHARALAVAENPEELAHRIVDKKMSVADTEKMVKNAKRSQNSRQIVKTGLDSGKIADIENRIKKALKVPVKLRERKGGAGEVVLSFATRIQMDELVERLVK
jgi:ParB family chromosome partitioning protein